MKTTRTAALTLLVLAACCGGCSSWVDRTASFGVMSPNRELLTLGAGDALGAQIYVNDRIIAAREAGSPMLAQMEEAGDLSSLMAH